MAGFETSDQSSLTEQRIRQEALVHFRSCPIPEDELLQNLGLFIRRQIMSRYIFMNDLYRKILPVQGQIFEFGVRWGQNLALFENFRGMYEPYNYHRRIVGFDTFDGFPHVDSQDGSAAAIRPGAYAVTAGYEKYLETILSYHERGSPIAHIKKFDLVKGDVTQTLPAYLARHPHTMLALVYFDLDLYRPTKACLERIMERVTKGTVLAFDERRR